MPAQYPFLDGLRWSIGNFRSNELLKWSAALTLANIGFSVVERVSGYSLLKAILAFAERGGKYFDFNYFFVSWLIMMGALLVSLYITARAIMSAMEVSKVKTAKKVRFGAWVWMQACKTLINVTCWYDKKLLIPAGIFALLAIATPYIFGINEVTIVGVLFFSGIFAFLAVIAWFAAMIVHFVRTSFAVYMFLEGEKGSVKVVEESDRMVRGKTVEVFLAQLLAFFALLIPLLIVYLLTGMGVELIFSKFAIVVQYDAGLALFFAGFALSVFTLALQQALSANIWAFFRKGRKA